MATTILHICSLPLFSGLEQYALRVAVEQKKRGHDVGFIALKGSALEHECAAAGIPTFLVDFNWQKSLWSAALQYRDIFARLGDSLQVVHLHSSQEIDRVGLAFLRGRLAGLPVGKPKIIQQNHTWISCSKKDPVHWLTHRQLDEIWCSSGQAQADLRRFLPYPSEKITVIHYGRDLSIVDTFTERAAARVELGLPVDATVVGAIARIDRGKGVWELINASVELMREGRDFHLVIIGGATLTDPAAVEFSQKVDAFVAGLPADLKSRVKLTGNIPNAGRLLKAFDIYCQVAYKETFSLALLDAQLAELPVIGTDSGGTPEVVRENETGWLALPENIESLKVAITRALEGRSTWQAYGKTARARVEKSFDINVVITDMLNKYELRKEDVPHGLR